MLQVGLLCRNLVQCNLHLGHGTKALNRVLLKRLGTVADHQGQEESEAEGEEEEDSDWEDEKESANSLSSAKPIGDICKVLTNKGSLEYDLIPEVVASIAPR